MIFKIYRMQIYMKFKDFLYICATFIKLHLYEKHLFIFNSYNYLL